MDDELLTNSERSKRSHIVRLMMEKPLGRHSVRLRPRDRDVDGKPAEIVTVEAHGATIGVDNFARDRETKSGAAAVLRNGSR